MDRNIVQEVYDLLETRTNELEEDKELMRSAQKRLESNDYSSEGKKKIHDEIGRLKQSIDSSVNRAMDEARTLIEGYRKEVHDENRLDPTKMTDDVKLLAPGIILKERDIEAMLDRNKDNKTMVQIILRYAEEKNIVPNGARLYSGGQQELQTANAMDGILSYYERWMKGDQALSMLKKFFSVSE